MSNEHEYNSWPIGQLPMDWRRPELAYVREHIYQYDDPFDVVAFFERKIATYAGSTYAVAVDSCTNALFLCLRYVGAQGWRRFNGVIKLPSRTYVSVPMACIHSGARITFEDLNWERGYYLKPTLIYDAAVSFTKNMYRPGSYYCLSFQMKKRLPIGRGGMILTNDRAAYLWLRKVRHDGRSIGVAYEKDIPKELGHHMYMTPEDAARGLILFEKLTEHQVYFPPVCSASHYPSLKEYPVWKSGEHLSQE